VPKRSANGDRAGDAMKRVAGAGTVRRATASSGETNHIWAGNSSRCYGPLSTAAQQRSAAISISAPDAAIVPTARASVFHRYTLCASGPITTGKAASLGPCVFRGRFRPGVAAKTLNWTMRTQAGGQFPLTPPNVHGVCRR
jgi:hypothetical protein